jgi:hypothetical protein
VAPENASSIVAPPPPSPPPPPPCFCDRSLCVLDCELETRAHSAALGEVSAPGSRNQGEWKWNADEPPTPVLVEPGGLSGYRLEDTEG